jgi:hypothetical protein
MPDNELDSFVKRNQKFLKLLDNESFTGTYMGFVIGVDPNNPDKEKVTYKFLPQGLDNPVYLASASVSFAKKMSTIAKSTDVKITRHGIEKNTTYEIVAL